MENTTRRVHSIILYCLICFREEGLALRRYALMYTFRAGPLKNKTCFSGPLSTAPGSYAATETASFSMPTGKVF